MNDRSQLKQAALELGLTEDEAEREVEDFMLLIGESIDWEYLISFGSNDRADYRRFVEAWEERYPDWAVRIQSNPHDFGSYLTIEVDMEAYGSDDFPKGCPETASLELADELGLEY